MKQSYLNAQQKSDTALIYRLLTYLVIVFGDWEKRGKLTEEESKELKVATQGTQNFITMILDSIDRAQAQKIIKDAQNLDLFFLTSAQAAAKKEAYIKEHSNETITVDSNTYHEIIGFATEVCKKCPESNSDACILKEYFIELGVPPLDPENDFCGYIWCKSRKHVTTDRFKELFFNIRGFEPTVKDINHFEEFRLVHKLYYDKTITEALARKFIVKNMGEKIELIRRYINENNETIMKHIDKAFGK